MKKKLDESFGLQSYKVTNSTQDNLKYFEIFIIIGIVGFDIDFSCFMFMERFLQDNARMGYVRWNRMEVCFICLYRWIVSL
jgi:hypothetical protein